MPAVFDSEYVKRINGPNLKPKGSKMDHAEMLMDDIRNFKESRGCDRLVMIWCGSTEVFPPSRRGSPDPRSVRSGSDRRAIRRFRPARFTPTPR